MKEKNLITLSGFGWEAVIVPQCGMNTIRLSHNDKQILRYPENLDMLFRARQVTVLRCWCRRIARSMRRFASMGRHTICP